MEFVFMFTAIHRITAFIALFCCASLMQAETWNGAGGGGLPQWSVPANWGGIAPVAGAALTFPSVTNKNAINDFANYSAFGPITINASGYVLSGNVITLNGGFFLNGVSSAQIGLPLVLATTQGFNVDHVSGILTQTGIVSGSGGLIKSGNGTLIISGAHSYAGGTLIDGGALQLQAGTTLPGVVQISKGYLIGTGTIGGMTSLNQSAAIIAPGTSSGIGTLTSNGNVRLYSADAMNFDVTNLGADKLVVNGSVNLGGAAIGIPISSSFAPAVGTTYTLIDNDGTDPLVLSSTDAPSDYLRSLTINSLKYQLSLVGGIGHNDAVLQRVANGVTTMTLTNSSSASNYGSPVTFTAQVSGITGGLVTFWDGANYLGGVVPSPIGQAALTLSDLPPGSRQVTAMFEGNTTYAPVRSSIMTHVVTGEPTSTALAVSPTSPSTAGAAITLTATVTAGLSPSGAVTFSDSGTVLGTTPVSTGQALFTTSALIAGSHSFTATFVPTLQFAASSSTAVTHTITGNATTTTLTTSASPVVAGTTVTFTATVVGGTPMGSVTFRDGAATLGSSMISAGVATYTLSGLSAGSHSMTATYGGATDHQPSNSATLVQIITAAPGGGGGSSSSGDTAAGGCGLGSGLSALALSLLFLLRFRRDH
jgi:autotransporter-associated beta strand protein